MYIYVECFMLIIVTKSNSIDLILFTMNHMRLLLYFAIEVGNASFGLKKKREEAVIPFFVILPLNCYKLELINKLYQTNKISIMYELH